ncbi:MAG: AAA family ATPase, partial [Acetatifactor sp.]|nr:AAA family ATPase [Acetatifactor sp.]
MRERQEAENLQKNYLDFLRDLLKDQPFVALAYMTDAETGNWYDGYRLKKFCHIYNPKSVVEAMRHQDHSNYWTSTETYEALKIYMDMDFDGLRSDIIQMLGGEYVKVNTRSFQNDMYT